MQGGQTSPCRFIDAKHADALRRGYSAIDQVYADLMIRRISWGEASSRYRNTLNQIFSQTDQASAAMNERLDQQHNAEMAQRAATASAIASGLQAQQAAVQRQQLINSMNRPVTTNCTRFGSNMSCSSF